MSGDICNCHDWGGASGKRSSYNAQEGLLPLTSVQKENYPVHNVSSAEVEKSQPKWLMLSKFLNFVKDER